MAVSALLAKYANSEPPASATSQALLLLKQRVRPNIVIAALALDAALGRHMSRGILDKDVVAAGWSGCRGGEAVTVCVELEAVLARFPGWLGFGEAGVDIIMFRNLEVLNAFFRLV
ncbi:hypothetical protein B0O99DRAFT_591004 [Bisporella sp. PMI_857]|nr:hypothetical protein B0O99DRAFT_591004 [Bisporella sp. PMI_857]